MKLSLAERNGIASAALVQTMWLTLGCLSLMALGVYAAQPAWWSSRGAVDSNPKSDNLALNEGQLKQFTAKAIQEMNANLSGGAGTTNNSMMSGWSNDYLTNGYSTTNAKPSDFQAVKVGQLKYIAGVIYAPLISGGYMAAKPTWLKTNSAVDYNVANLGQLKQVFNFEIAAPQTPTNLVVVLGTTNATVSWTDPVLSVAGYTLQDSTNGGTTWSTVATVSGATNSASIIGLTLGANYLFRTTATNAAGSSSPSTSDAAPVITLTSPSGATFVP